MTKVETSLEKDLKGIGSIPLSSAGGDARLLIDQSVFYGGIAQWVEQGISNPSTRVQIPIPPSVLRGLGDEVRDVLLHNTSPHRFRGWPRFTDNLTDPTLHAQSSPVGRAEAVMADEAARLLSPNMLQVSGSTPLCGHFFL